MISPVGDEASRLSAIPISEGFNLGYCRAKPGRRGQGRRVAGRDRQSVAERSQPAHPSLQRSEIATDRCPLELFAEVGDGMRG